GPWSARRRCLSPGGPAKALPRRRPGAGELVEQGEPPEDVAYFLGCGRSSVYTWVKPARQAPEKLAAKPHTGPKPRLSAEQLRELEALLLQGAITKRGVRQWHASGPRKNVSRTRPLPAPMAA